MGALVFFLGFFRLFCECVSRFWQKGVGGGAEQRVLRCALVAMRKGGLLLVGESENSASPPI